MAVESYYTKVNCDNAYEKSKKWLESELEFLRGAK